MTRVLDLKKRLFQDLEVTGVKETQEKLKYQEKERENFLIGLIGTNKVGKTTVEEQIAREWKESRDDDYMVISFDPRNKLREVSDFFIQLDDEDILSKMKKLRNALLILDDYRTLHEQDKAETWLLYLLQARSEQNIDIMYSIHNPALVINMLTYFTTHYYIFYTQVQEGGWRKKIPNYTTCIAVSNYVNKYVKIYGRGEYPNFPYMIIDNENEEVIAQNMNME